MTPPRLFYDRQITKLSAKKEDPKRRRPQIASNRSAYSDHAKKYHGFYIHEGTAPPLKAFEKEMPARVLTVVDLFSGAGGFTLGFVQAGFVPIFAIEIDKDAAAPYEAPTSDLAVTPTTATTCHEKFPARRGQMYPCTGYK